MAINRVNHWGRVGRLILVLGLSASSLAQAAGPEYYNTNVGGNSNMFPFGTVSGKEVNWLFRPGELVLPMPAPAGNITDIYFLGSTSSETGSNTYTDLTIRMAQDTITDLTAGQFYAGPWTTVYSRGSGSLDWTPGVWTGITLDTPFVYDPAKSLILDVSQIGMTSWGGGTYVLAQTAFPGIRRTWSQGGSPFTPASSDGAVANFGVDIDGGGPVASVPVPAAALLVVLGLGPVGLLTRRQSRRG